MKVFISGKVSNLPYKQVKEKFIKAEFILHHKGYETVNPVRFIPPDAPQPVAMRNCLLQLLDCDAIYMLSDWEQSPGATLEHEVAKQCGLRIIEDGICLDHIK